MSFETAFSFTLGHEGGYVNDSHDPGGETKYGISKRSYPAVDIKSLTLEQAKAIYQRDYWQAASCERMPPKIAIAVFDSAVHHGPTDRDQAAAAGAESGGRWRIRPHHSRHAAEPRLQRNAGATAGATCHLPDNLPGVADLQARLAQAAV